MRGEEKAFRDLVVRAMASVLHSSGTQLGDELACWRRLRGAGFSLEAIGDHIAEVRREALRRRLRLLGRGP
jgi:hypothetical protein